MSYEYQDQLQSRASDISQSLGQAFNSPIEWGSLPRDYQIFKV